MKITFALIVAGLFSFALFSKPTVAQDAQPTILEKAPAEESASTKSLFNGKDLS